MLWSINFGSPCSTLTHPILLVNTLVPQLPTGLFLNRGVVWGNHYCLTVGEHCANPRHQARHLLFIVWDPGSRISPIYQHVFTICYVRHSCCSVIFTFKLLILLCCLSAAPWKITWDSSLCSIDKLSFPPFPIFSSLL